MAEQLAMLALLADADVLVGTKPTADRQGSTACEIHAVAAGGSTAMNTAEGTDELYPSTGSHDGHPSDAPVTQMICAAAPEGSPHGTEEPEIAAENARPTVGRGPDRCDRCLGGEVAKGQHELFRVGKHLLCGRCKRGAR